MDKTHSIKRLISFRWAASWMFMSPERAFLSITGSKLTCIWYWWTGLPVFASAPKCLISKFHNGNVDHSFSLRIDTGSSTHWQHCTFKGMRSGEIVYASEAECLSYQMAFFKGACHHRGLILELHLSASLPNVNCFPSEWYLGTPLQPYLPMALDSFMFRCQPTHHTPPKPWIPQPRTPGLT